MGISIGGIDITDTLLNSEMRISVLEKLVQHILNRMPLGTLTQSDIERFRAEAISELQKKYPQAGIQERPKPI